MLSDVGSLTDSIDIAVRKFETHPSILSIKHRVQSTPTFDFVEISLDEITNEINMLNKKKAGTFGNIPAKHLKESANICKTY